MALPFIFKFNMTPAMTTSLPAWAQNTDIYRGTFSSPSGYQTSYASRPNQTSGKATVDFVKALCRASMIVNGCDTDGYGNNIEYGISEMTLSVTFEGNTVGPGEVCSVVYKQDDGQFFAEKGGVALDFNKVGVAPFILAMWGHMVIRYSEFAKAFSDFCTASSDEQKQALACYLCDMLYDKVKNGEVPVCNGSQVKSLTAARRSGPIYRPTTYEGHFTKFSVTNRGKSKKSGVSADGRAIATKDFLGKFQFRTEPLTAEQEARVPKLDDKYVVTEELLMVCKHIKETTGKRRPIRNILYRGAPGVGKSESYVGIAAGCHLPLYTFAANALTEPYDLFGTFIPVDDEGNQTGPKVPIEKILSGMPSADEISLDPGFCFQQITGIPKKDATPTECMAAMFNLAQKSLDVGGGQQKFRFAPGQLIYALRDGGVWGLDEVTLPQNPGVIPALNPAMDSTQSITLPTGEVIHRHPDCIFVGTTNIDLEGCRQLNQAWVDRCQLIIELPEPADEVLMARLKSMVDWDENDAATKAVDLDKFMKAYHELKEIARKRRLDDGTIGPRKLADWVMSTMITQDPVTSAKMTIIPGATADTSGMAELEQKIMDIF